MVLDHHHRRSINSRGDGAASTTRRHSCGHYRESEGYFLFVGELFPISTVPGSRPWRRSLFVLSYSCIKMKAGAFSNLPTAARWFPQKWDAADRIGKCSGSASLRRIRGGKRNDYPHPLG